MSSLPMRGLPEAAKVTVVRNEPSKIFEIDLTQPADMNLLVRSGDVVTLHRNVTQFIYVGGEVKFPGEDVSTRLNANTSYHLGRRTSES